MLTAARVPARSVGSLLAALLCAMLLSACESTPGPAASDTTVIVTDDGSIESLLREATRSEPQRAAELYLQAAWRYFDRGASADAERTLESVDAARLSNGARSSWQLLNAELALARGDLTAAESWFAALNLGAGSVTLTPASRCAARGDFLCAANALMTDGTSTDARAANVDLIWRYVSLAPPLAVAEQARVAEGDARGWWQLKDAMLRAQSPEEQAAAVNFWRRAWPDHPAARRLPTRLASSLAASWRPGQLAVLLPLSGPLAPAGQAVRDGLVAAYLSSNPRSELRLRFYDTEARSLAGIYEQLLVDGADVIVGPLRRERVAAFNALAPSLPTLALNYLEERDSAQPQLYQLGLAIEDEARTIARRLDARGFESVLVFHNFDDWSLRARRQLTGDWEGTTTEQALTDLRTITEAVGSAMEVEASQARHEALAELLGEELEFLPRARRDVQAVVALIDNVEANALAPALRFHFADDLPVYACSQVVRGASTDALTELARFEVSELPWFLSADPLFEAMAAPFELEGNRFSSLHALGVDAFRVSRLLGTFPRDNGSVLVGSTGGLMLEDGGRFQRQLSWGVIRGGTLLAAAEEQVTPAR